MKKKKPIKQKIDVVLEPLFNLEQQMKELIKRIELIEATLKYQYPYIPMPRYDGVTWNDGCQNKVSK